VLRPLLAGVDVLLASRHDLEALLGASDEAPALARAAIDRFGHELVVLRETRDVGAGAVAVTITAIAAGEEVTSPTYEATVVDAFGAGDAALGVLLGARLGGADLATAIDAAAWACAFQHTTRGDAWQGRASDVAQRELAGRRVLR
jgi:2-dehydro-3-deoxygluconokinase